MATGYRRPVKGIAKRIVRPGRTVSRRSEIQIQLATSRRGVPRADVLRGWAQAALSADMESICIRIVGNREMQILNHRWRRKNKPTNVLAFPFDGSLSDKRSPEAGSRLFGGDLAICAPVVAREAREQGKSLQSHWAHMVVHGLLHLQGFDHVNNRDAKRMEAREVEILSGFGYPNPYLGSASL